MAELDQSYPLPNKKGWEDKYRYAKALESASESIIKFFQSLESHYEMLLEKEKDEEKSIEES